jgi:GT2 family glycosyltransferase
VLYHWHAVDGSIAASTTAKVGIADKQVRAVQSYLDRNAISAIATKHPTLPHRCRIKPVLNDYPRVTIIIPSKDQADIIKVCLDSIYNKTTYPNFEVIVVDSGTTQPEALEVLASHPVRVVPLERQFNFSAACNLGAKMASGAILVFLNNDTEVITEDWLEHLVFHLTAEDVGAVGPLLLYPDGKVQHAGVVLGARGTADHVMRHFPADSDGYAGSLSCPHEVSAVTGACLAVKKSTFLEIEEFSELYVTHYQDVDLCLKLRQRSLRCIFTPEARLFHHESLSRGQNSYDFLDRLLLIDSWREVLSTSDPYYPKQFSIDRLDYSIN